MFLRAPFAIDPRAPRAPSTEAWQALTPEERAWVVDHLPSEFELAACPPEGDFHRLPIHGALGALGEYFRRVGRRVYLSSNLPVYYPDEPVFAPDLLAVVDVEPHPRMRWVVSAEGRGLDLVVEVVVAHDPAKDLERNVEHYAGLGIPEYFVYDRRHERLHGYALMAPAARSYRRLVPQTGRYPSAVLGLELGLERGRLRFYAGTASVPETDELVARANQLAAEALERAEEEARRAEDEARRAAEEARRAAELSQRLVAAEAEIERLRRG